MILTWTIMMMVDLSSIFVLEIGAIFIFVVLTSVTGLMMMDLTMNEGGKRDIDVGDELSCMT